MTIPSEALRTKYKYLEYLESQSDLAPTTIELYGKVISLLEEYLQDKNDINTINGFLVRSGRKGMYYAKFAIIRWLEWQDRHAEVGQLVKIRGPRGRKRSINIIRKEQYERIIGELRGAHRDIFMLCFWTGLRAGEAIKLKRKNFQWNDEKGAYMISLRGKGNKGGVVAYGRSQEDVLDKYMPLQSNNYLFLTRDAETLNERELRPKVASAYNRYREALASAGQLVGIPNLSTHDARRTFGTRIRQQKDIMAAKRALRHSQITTTVRYIGDDEQEEAVDAMLAIQGG